MEDDLNPSWVTLANNLSGSTCISAQLSYAYLNKYDLVKVIETGEILLITNVSATAVTAVRNYMASTSAVSAASGNNLLIIGSAFEEGSAYSTLVTKSTVNVAQTNYTQIFRKAVEITRSLFNTELYGGNDRNYQRKKKGIELMRDLERAFLFGEPLKDIGTKDSAITHARRTTGGINYYISTNATDAGGVLTEAEFEGFCRTIFRYGGTSKYLFASPLIISVVSQWAAGKLQMFPKDKTYGIAISQYLSPHGTLNLVKEVLLEHAGSLTSTSYFAGYGFAVELPECVYRFLQNSDVKMETDIQIPGDDLYKDQYLCEVGMEFHNEKQHGKLTGVTG